jgi:hypothetical protein
MLVAAAKPPLGQDLCRCSFTCQIDDSRLGVIIPPTSDSTKSNPSLPSLVKFGYSDWASRLFDSGSTAASGVA